MQAEAVEDEVDEDVEDGDDEQMGTYFEVRAAPSNMFHNC